MNGEAQVLKMEIIEISTTNSEIENDGIEETANSEAKRSNLFAGSIKEIDFTKSGGRFARLKKHLRKRSVSIL